MLVTKNPKILKYLLRIRKLPAEWYFVNHTEYPNLYFRWSKCMHRSVFS